MLTRLTSVIERFLTGPAIHVMSTYFTYMAGHIHAAPLGKALYSCQSRRDTDTILPFLLDPRYVFVQVSSSNDTTANGRQALLLQDLKFPFSRRSLLRAITRPGTSATTRPVPCCVPLHISASKYLSCTDRVLGGSRVGGDMANPQLSCLLVTRFWKNEWPSRRARLIPFPTSAKCHCASRLNSRIQ